MQELPSETLKLILGLRKENGLEATEAAARKDMGKARWATVETPRYRRAGRSPIFVSGKYLSSAGRDPITGEPDGQAASSMPSGRVPHGSKGKIDELAFYKLLHEKGYSVKHTVNSLTGATEKELPSVLAQIDLHFSAITANATGVHVTQTTPQVQVAMSLETFLELAGIKP